MFVFLNELVDLLGLKFLELKLAQLTITLLGWIGEEIFSVNGKKTTT